MATNYHSPHPYRPVHLFEASKHLGVGETSPSYLDLGLNQGRFVPDEDIVHILSVPKSFASPRKGEFHRLKLLNLIARSVEADDLPYTNFYYAFAGPRVEVFASRKSRISNEG
jgi:hypothetical protein